MYPHNYPADINASHLSQPLLTGACQVGSAPQVTGQSQLATPQAFQRPTYLAPPHSYNPYFAPDSTRPTSGIADRTVQVCPQPPYGEPSGLNLLANVAGTLRLQHFDGMTVSPHPSLGGWPLSTNATQGSRINGRRQRLTEAQKSKVVDIFKNYSKQDARSEIVKYAKSEGISLILLEKKIRELSTGLNKSKNTTKPLCDEASSSSSKSGGKQRSFRFSPVQTTYLKELCIAGSKCSPSLDQIARISINLMAKDPANAPEDLEIKVWDWFRNYNKGVLKK